MEWCVWKEEATSVCLSSFSFLFYHLNLLQCHQELTGKTHWPVAFFLHRKIFRQSNSLMEAFLYECCLNKSWLAAAAWCRAAAGESWAGFNFALQPSELSPRARCSTHAATPATDGLVKMIGKKKLHQDCQVWCKCSQNQPLLQWKKINKRGDKGKSGRWA